MNTPTKAGILVALGAATVSIPVWLRYRETIGAARARVRADAKLADTPAGLIEYAEVGVGPPLLSIHGAGGGFDQGLMLARQMGLDPREHRIIAPSRFGYLGTPVPAGSTNPAAQADAHAALLETLGINGPVVVMGVSAGAPSALQFALRHPEQLRALILIVPGSWAMQEPGSGMGKQKIGGNGFINNYILRSDFLFWLATRLARQQMLSFIGVPRLLLEDLSDEDEQNLCETLESILPLSQRYRGFAVEASSFKDLKPYPVAEIKAPTLIIDSADVVTYEGSAYLASQIPGAEFVSYESGGHLLVGHGPETRRAIGAFLKRLQQQ